MNPRGLSTPNQERKVTVEYLVTEAVNLCWEFEEKLTEPRGPGQITEYERGMIDLLAVTSFSNSFEDAFGAMQDKREEIQHSIEADIIRAEKSHNRAAQELTEAKSRLEKIQCNSTE